MIVENRCNVSEFSISVVVQFSSEEVISSRPVSL